MGGGFFGLIGSLIGAAAVKLSQLVMQRGVQIGIGIGGAAAGAGVQLGDLREQAALLAGNTGPQGLEEAARTAARMLGLGGDRVLWPISNRTGQLIIPRYFVIDLIKGRAWYIQRYFSRRSARGRFGFGRRRFSGGWGRGSWRGGQGPAATINNNAG